MYSIVRENERRSIIVRFVRNARPANRPALISWYSGVSKSVPTGLPLFGDAYHVDYPPHYNETRLIYSSVVEASQAIRRMCRLSFPSHSIDNLRVVDRAIMENSLSIENTFTLIRELNGKKTFNQKETTQSRNRYAGDGNNSNHNRDHYHNSRDSSPERNDTPIPSDSEHTDNPIATKEEEKKAELLNPAGGDSLAAGRTRRRTSVGSSGGRSSKSGVMVDPKKKKEEVDVQSAADYVASKLEEAKRRLMMATCPTAKPPSGSSKMEMIKSHREAVTLAMDVQKYMQNESLPVTLDEVKMMLSG